MSMKNDKHMGVSGRSRYLQKLQDKMKSGMSHTDAYNEILNEEDSDGPPFDLKKRKEISDVLFHSKDAAKIVRAHEEAVKWEVKSLDVWGNKKDGFEVNQEFGAGEIEVPPMTDDAGLLKLLKDGGFIKESVRLSQVSFEDTGSGFIEVANSKTGEPLYFLYGPS
jgi:hypothetical protein